MVKRKRQASSSSKPTTTATTTSTVTTAATVAPTLSSQSISRRAAQNGRQSDSNHNNSHHLQVKRSRSTDSADSTSAPQIRGRSAPTPTSSSRDNAQKIPTPDLYNTMTDIDTLPPE